VARRSPSIDVNGVLASFRLGSQDPSDEATAALLDATTSLLSSYGVRRWSMDDVAERSGLGRATVYRRFEGRDDLVHAALARDAHRFFGAIAAAVSGHDDLEAKVVEGFLVGVRFARQSLLPTLVRSDTEMTLSVLTSTPVVARGRAARVDRYEAVTGIRLSGPDRQAVELVAEALVRLAISFILMPDSVVDFDDEDAARISLYRIIGPLLARPRSALAPS
jgi:AcrR family transcriptional regulator